MVKVDGLKLTDTNLDAKLIDVLLKIYVKQTNSGQRDGCIATAALGHTVFRQQRKSNSSTTHPRRSDDK